MKKDKEWLRGKVRELLNGAVEKGRMEYYEYEEMLHWLDGFIDQLDEPDKVVIPKYVAEQLKYWERNDMNILWQFWLKEVPSSVLWWLEGEQGNFDKLLNAVKHGYTVKEEKRYRVIFPTLGGWNERMAIMSNGSNYYIEEITDPDYEVAELTEAEIKAIDERYWTFAEEVAE